MLAYWAAHKGLDLIGTGDFTHPGWREELRRLLTPAGNGFYTPVSYTHLDVYKRQHQFQVAGGTWCA